MSIRKIKDHGPYLVDEKYLGEYNEHTTGIVMDCINDRDKMKPRIKVMRTENINLLTGSSTVAVFKIKRPEALEAEIVVEEEKPINFSVSMSDFLQSIKRQKEAKMDIK